MKLKKFTNNQNKMIMKQIQDKLIKKKIKQIINFNKQKTKLKYFKK